MKIQDSRDLQERLEELEGERQSFVDAHEGEELTSEHDAASWEEVWEHENESDAEELKAIQSLADEVGSEWKYGTAIIPDRDFEDHAREMAQDLYGKELRDSQWPFSHIDWEGAAEALKQDYSMTTFQGEDVWYRA